MGERFPGTRGGDRCSGGIVGRLESGQAPLEALERRVKAIDGAGLGEGWIDGDVGHGPAYRFRDPDGHGDLLAHDAVAVGLRPDEALDVGHPRPAHVEVDHALGLLGAREAATPLREAARSGPADRCRRRLGL